MQNPYKIQHTFIIRDNFKHYDLERCFQYLEAQGKSTYGQTFKIHEDDKPIIYKLLVYAIRDEKNAVRIGLNLNKGIMLSGPIGCGKTSIMHLIKPFFYMRFDYKIKTTREIAFDFAKTGYEAISIYTQKTPSQNRLTGYCFDDLGAEQQIKHYGNECNVMAEILLSRYEEFIANQSVTHITTNLNASEIEQLYGNRLRSRFRQMFNLLSFSSESKDKR